MELAKQNYSHDKIMNFSDSKDPIDDDDDVVDVQQSMERVDITDDAGRPRHHPQSFP